MMSTGIGLRCRLPDGCPDNFRAIPSDSSSREALAIACRMRNEHEIEQHGYTHVETSLVLRQAYAGGRWDYNFSVRGRSALSFKKKGVLT